MDPTYSQAYVGLAQAYRKNVLGGKSFQDKTGQDFGGSHYLMRHYLELAMKNPTPDAYSILALFEIRRRHYKEALKLAEKAVELAPNSADALINLGLNLVYIDKPKEAIQYIKQAIRLNPLEGNFELGFAYMAMENYEKAIESVQLSLTDNPQLLHPHIVSAVSYAHLGNEDKAKEEFNKYLKSWYDGYYPDMQFIYFMYCFKNPDVFNRFIEGLVKAGYKKDSRGSLCVGRKCPKNSDRVRITAQLIDATTEHHLWAERYDREMKDIFALQDEITMKIVGSLQITLTSGEQGRMLERQYKTFRRSNEIFGVIIGVE